MHSVTIIILHAFVFPGLAKVDIDKLGDKFIDKLVDKLFAKTSTLTNQGLAPANRAQMISSLPGSSALKNRVISAMETNNRRCMVRDVSVKAADSLPSMEPISREKLNDMPGVTAPMGLFDPIGIAANVPEGRLLFYREAELKHGRVCMLAILGLIVGETHAFIPLLTDGIAPDTPAYLLGTPFVQQTSIANFWPTALFALGVEEWRSARNFKYDATTLSLPLDATPGDYGWDPLNMKPKDPKALKELQNKELNNGRLAMFAAAGIIAQEQVTGHNIFGAR
jgi:hypothetical protein